MCVKRTNNTIGFPNLPVTKLVFIFCFDSCPKHPVKGFIGQTYPRAKAFINAGTNHPLIVLALPQTKRNCGKWVFVFPLFSESAEEMKGAAELTENTHVEALSNLLNVFSFVFVKGINSCGLELVETLLYWCHPQYHWPPVANFI